MDRDLRRPVGIGTVWWADAGGRHLRLYVVLYLSGGADGGVGFAIRPHCHPAWVDLVAQTTRAQAGAGVFLRSSCLVAAVLFVGWRLYWDRRGERRRIGDERALRRHEPPDRSSGREHEDAEPQDRPAHLLASRVDVHRGSLVVTCGAAVQRPSASLDMPSPRLIEMGGNRYRLDRTPDVSAGGCVWLTRIRRTCRAASREPRAARARRPST